MPHWAPVCHHPLGPPAHCCPYVRVLCPSLSVWAGLLFYLEYLLTAAPACWMSFPPPPLVPIPHSSRVSAQGLCVHSSPTCPALWLTSHQAESQSWDLRDLLGPTKALANLFCDLGCVVVSSVCLCFPN